MYDDNDEYLRRARLEQARKLRELYMQGWAVYELAAEFGLSPGQVTKVVRGKLPDEEGDPRKARHQPGRKRMQRPVVPGSAHGTITGYFTDKCGCDACFSAYRAYYLDRQAKLEATKPIETTVSAPVPGRRARVPFLRRRNR